ncbi:hypothetical protein [Marinactinospora rubrisoli]|uniref:MarR family transcriptional regulator n=1 Tax=Marinactinospora rubrisoli TaxID=2715399 RepID=A0ABW2KHI7_9ACTN
MRRNTVREPSQAELARYARKAGDVFASVGMPRLAGEVFGYLLVCDPELRTAGQIAEALGVERSDVDAPLRLLAAIQLVQRSIPPHSPTPVYRLPDTAHWRDLARARLRLPSAVRSLTEEGLVLVGDEEGLGRGRRLREIRDFTRLVEQDFGPLRERLEAHLAARDRGEVPRPGSAHGR